MVANRLQRQTARLDRRKLCQPTGRYRDLANSSVSCHHAHTDANANADGNTTANSSSRSNGNTHTHCNTNTDTNTIAYRNAVVEEHFSLLAVRKTDG